MDFAAAVATLGVIAATVYLGGAYALHRVVRRQDRAIAELRNVVAHEGERIERTVQNYNGEAKALITHAVGSASRAAKAAEQAERASDRSIIASEAAAVRAEEARHRAQEAGLWARLAGAVRSRPIELRHEEDEPRVSGIAPRE